MLGFAREMRPATEWEAVHKDTAEMERASWEAFNAGDRSPMAMRGFFISGSFGDDTKGHFEEINNELLGIKNFSDEVLK